MQIKQNATAVFALSLLGTHGLDLLIDLCLDFFQLFFINSLTVEADHLWRVERIVLVEDESEMGK